MQKRFYLVVLFMPLIAGCRTPFMKSSPAAAVSVSTNAPGSSANPRVAQIESKQGTEQTSEKIMHEYLYNIAKFDGITKEEAVVIAQSQLIFRGQDKQYALTKPQLVMEDNDKWEFRFVPTERTLADGAQRTPVLVDVDKGDGQADFKKEEK